MNNSKYNFELLEKETMKESSKFDSFYDLSILMPPPNITGNLHLGHALDLTIQDFIVRFNFLIGKKIKWITGLDHAGIATQSRVDSLNIEFKNHREKKDFTLNHWYPQQKEKFKQQWKELGFFIDYSQDNFTMNLDVQFKVKKYFINLYNDGLIYKSNKMINWDPKLQTAISDVEVEYERVTSTLFYIKYLIDNERDSITIATSRPETIFADVALFVNPNDDRYKKYIGLFALNPFNKKRLKIFSSNKVKMDFGTGVLKCTPGHDFEDYDLAKEFNLPIIFCYGKNGIFNSLAGRWESFHFKNSKKEIIEYLKSKNLLIKEEKYQTKAAKSQRSNELIEPLISLQWFLDLPLMVKKIESRNPNFLDEIDFFPYSTKDKLNIWKKNLKEWCISRQLWWGHQIPIWYKKFTNDFFASENPPTDGGSWEVDKDVLDTWFSSSLWPLILSPKENDNDFYPIDYLVVGSDLLFFWLFKMIVFSFYFHKKPPFKNVFIHGLIRDKNGKKMSKSLGNGIEPEEVISKYGSDSLRLFLLTNNVFDNDLLFDEEKLKGSYFFLQKLWSIFNFISMNIDDKNIKVISWEDLAKMIKEEKDIFSKILSSWLINELNIVEKNYLTFINNNLDTSSLSRILIDFSKEKISNNYIYLMKKINNKIILITLLYVFQRLIIMLDPFVPFISNYIYKEITGKHIKNIDFNVSYEEIKKDNIDVIELIFLIRNKIFSYSKEENVHHSSICFYFEKSIFWKCDGEIINLFFERLKSIEKINISFEKSKNKDNKFEIIDIYPFGSLFFMKSNKINSEKDYEKTLAFFDANIKRSFDLLNNEGFIKKAPRHLILSEQNKLANYLKQREKIFKN